MYICISVPIQYNRKNIDKNKSCMLTLVLKYSPAKQKTKASIVTAKYGIINCTNISNLLVMFISKD